VCKIFFNSLINYYLSTVIISRFIHIDIIEGLTEIINVCINISVKSLSNIRTLIIAVKPLPMKLADFTA
jgi:hypothetical protein